MDAIDHDVPVAQQIERDDRNQHDVEHPADDREAGLGNFARAPSSRSRRLPSSAPAACRSAAACRARRSKRRDAPRATARRSSGTTSIHVGSCARKLPIWRSMNGTSTSRIATTTTIMTRNTRLTASVRVMRCSSRSTSGSPRYANSAAMTNGISTGASSQITKPTMPIRISHCQRISSVFVRSRLPPFARMRRVATRARSRHDIVQRRSQTSAAR